MERTHRLKGAKPHREERHMDNLAQMFAPESKVVISPDEMRAWVMLPPPKKECPYTEEGLRAWLLQNGVTFGIREDMIKTALRERKNGELMEVARGQEAKEGSHGRLEFRIEQQENAGLRTGVDGAVVLDDLSFLQELPAGTVLADIVPATPGISGCSVNGKELLPRNTVHEAKPLDGDGFEKSEDGQHYVVPTQSHIRFVDGNVQLTPVMHVETICAEDGSLEFEGDVVVDKDVQAGSVIKAAGSVFVAGRCREATIEAKRSILLCGGMHALHARGALNAKENIWGLHFEQTDLKAGRDIFASHLRGCEAAAQGQVRVLGKQGLVVGCEIHAREGFVCQTLGSEGDKSEIYVGIEKNLLNRSLQVAQNIEKRTQEVQSLLQNLSTIERLNRQRPNGGKDLPEYQEMLKKKTASLQVLKMLEQERQNLKRKMDGLSASGVVVRDRVFPGVLISIDTREYMVDKKMGKVRFKRDGEYIELLTSQ